MAFSSLARSSPDLSRGAGIGLSNEPVEQHGRPGLGCGEGLLVSSCCRLRQGHARGPGQVAEHGLQGLPRAPRPTNRTVLGTPARPACAASHPAHAPSPSPHSQVVRRGATPGAAQSPAAPPEAAGAGEAGVSTPPPPPPPKVLPVQLPSTARTFGASPWRRWSGTWHAASAATACSTLQRMRCPRCRGAGCGSAPAWVSLQLQLLRSAQGHGTGDLPSRLPAPPSHAGRGGGQCRRLLRAEGARRRQQPARSRHNYQGGPGRADRPQGARAAGGLALR